MTVTKKKIKKGCNKPLCQLLDEASIASIKKKDAKLLKFNRMLKKGSYGVQVALVLPKRP